MTGRLLHALWLLLVVLLALTAATLTAARLLVPMLGEYRLEAERLASETLHRPVSIERMEASWRGFNPVLKFKGVSVAGDGLQDGRLAIEQVWVGLDILRYLFDRQIRVASIDVIGAAFDVVKDRDGHIYIDRLHGEAGSAAAPALLDGGRFSLHKSDITYRDLKTGRPALHFSVVSLTLRNSAGLHVLNGDVMLPEQLGHRLAVHAEFSGPLERANDWRGRVYVTGRSLSIMPDILKDVAPGIDAQGSTDIRCWINFGESRLRSVSAEVELHNFRLRNRGDDRTADYVAEQVSGVFGWRRRAADWQFAVRDLTIARNGTRHAPTQLTLVRHEETGKGTISGTASRIALQDLQPLVALLPGIEEPYRNRFARLRPEGLIETFTIRLDDPAQGPPRLLWFDASLRDVGVRQADGLPGFGGLTGTATGTQDGGTFWISSQDFIYQDDRLFTEPLHFDEFSGEGVWQYQEGRLSLGSKALNLSNGDLAVGVRLALEHLPEEPAPRLDLQVAVNRFQIDSIRHYLPAHVMSATGVHWLEHSLLGGNVTGGSVVLKGRLDQLPFDKGEGLLQARLPVTNALLDFDPGWTPIRNLDAQVDFDGRSMDIRSHRGTIRSASLASVHAQIKDLAKPDLVLEGAVQGDLPVMLAELGSSPLGDVYGAFVDRVVSAGAAGLDLNLLVPLHHDDKEIEVKGDIILKDNTLKVQPDGPALEHIKGQLAFTAQGISGKGLKAKLLGAPVSVDVSTDVTAGVTRVSMNGPIDVSGYLAGAWQGKALPISGRSDWNVVLGIGRLQGRNQVPEVDLSLTSDLQGIAVDLPAPLGKTRQESRRLGITVDRVSKPDKTLRFSYADLLQGICEIRDNGKGMSCSRGTIHLGTGKAVLPQERVMLVTGHTPAFSLTRWQQVLGSARSGPGLPVKLDVVIDELEVQQHVVRDVTLRSEEAGLVRVFRLDGPASAGTIELTRTGAGVVRVMMNLDRLFLEKHPVPGAADEAPPKAENFPELQITIRKFKYNDVNYGELQLQAVRTGNTVHVERLLVASKKINLQATGDWRTANGQNLSQFDVEIKEGKLASLLEAYDFKEDMTGGELSGTLHASWQGAPWEFTPARVNGKLYLLIKDGQLLDVEPGAGRVFGLLSLHTLQRRLSLDFSDLFKKGFAFDRIEGNFVLDNGDAYTNDLVINGPAARIEISGRIGLANNDYDELVTVIPSMTSSIPLAGALAGGPAVGAALLVAERLLGDKLEQVSRFTHTYYAVTGPWSDPVFTKIELPPVEQADKTPAKAE